MLSVAAALALASYTAAQGIGTFTPEVHPPLPFSTCTTKGGCKAQNGSVVLDANYRWLHTASGDTCNPSGFNETLCPDAKTCAANCELDGADYAGTYGVTTNGSAVSITFGTGGARIYLLNDQEEYENFHVLDQEFTFDVDVSKVPCGYNGALYFSEMQPNGGKSDLNKAGAAYGTGYCDSQCPTGVNFFDGTVNYNGSLGSCCNEMDLWEANSQTTALTPHPCNVTGDFTCLGAGCENLCDPSGCDFNPFRMGNQSFYGPNKTVDTNKPFTVVTQFLTNNGSKKGTLTAINRIYVQNGQVIHNSMSTLPGIERTNEINSQYCEQKIDVLGDAATFTEFGGLKVMGESLGRGAVLVFSLWDSLGSGMDWLDGLEGTNATAPGALRGPCSDSQAVSDPEATVVFSNIRVGDLGSTFKQSH